jgi:uncharacterized protein YgiM (DUF1202 family)
MRRPPSPWCLLVLLLATTSLQAQTFVATQAVRLRRGPSTSDPVIRTLRRGERVTLLEESGSHSFFRVRTDKSEEGWVHGRYLRPPPSPRTSALAFTEAAASMFPACGGEHHFRWAAKTSLGQLGLAPQEATIPDILRWRPLGLEPDLASWCAPRQGRELRAYAVTAWVRRVRKHEADGDWHIEITGTAQADPTSCLVAEIPAPSYDPRFGTARDALDALLKDSVMNTTGDVSSPVRVRFTGAAFYDGWHSTGTAAIGHGRCNSSLGALWEIHPVFSVGPPP